MADATRTYHGQLVGGVVRRVEFTENYRAVEVLSRDDTAEIFVLVGSTTQEPKEVSVGMNEADILPAAIGAVEIPSPEAGNTVVKLISTGTPTFSIRGLR